MKSNKQKRQELAARRDRKFVKQREQERAWKLRRQWALVRRGELAPVDFSKLRSYGKPLFENPPTDPQYASFYEDIPFTCKDCGKQEVWTAHQQKWWREEMGGGVETRAVRCQDCRAKERARKTEANRVREEGLERKRREQDQG